MAEDYAYKGTTYTFDDGVSEEDKIKKIEDYLSKQAKPKEKKESKISTDAKTEHEGVMQEFAEGVGSGVIGIGQGIGELVGMGIDAMADTNYSSSVTKAANDLRTAAGIDPEGFAGKGAEIVTQFAVPGLGAAAAVSKLSKVGKIVDRVRKIGSKGKIAPSATGAKFALGAQQVVAAGAADAIVATDGITTIGDFFEGGPTQTNQEIGLKGREEAYRRFTNKLKLGAEGAGATVAVPLVLKGIGKGVVATGADVPILKGLGATTRFVEDKVGSHLGNFLDDIEARKIYSKAEIAEEGLESKLTGKAFQERGKIREFGEDTLANVTSWFKYRGMLPEEVAEAKSLIPGVSEAALGTATKTLNSLEGNINKGIKEYKKIADNIGKAETNLLRTDVFNKIEEVLTNPLFGQNAKANKSTLKQEYAKHFEGLPENMRKPLESALDDMVSMRNQIDDLSEDILKSDYLLMLDKITPVKAKETLGATIRKTIQHNLNSYLRRRYKVFEDAAYQPSEAAKKIAINGFKNDKKGTINELKKLANTRGEDISDYGLTKKKGKIVLEGDKVTDAQAKLAVENFLKRYKAPSSSKLLNRVAENKLNTNLFLKTRLNQQYQRELLGEIKNPREAFLGTIADLSEFKSIDNFFGKVRKLADQNEGIGKLFKNTDNMTKAQVQNEKNLGRIILGPTHSGVMGLGVEGAKVSGKKALEKSGWGSLTGHSVPEQVFKDLTRYMVGDLGGVGNFIRGTYSGFLRGKGVVQYGKTVLSPITQIRNVTTASLFALAQGNIGRGSTLGESIRLVGDDIFKNVPKERVLKELEELKELGVIGTQTELREIQSLISQGLGFSEKNSLRGIPLGQQFGSKITDNKAAKFLGSVNRKAQDMYQGGDNIWKIYNYKFEMNKLQNALRGLNNTDKLKFLNRGSKTPIKEATPDAINKLIKEEAARVVRNTVPNYNLTPELIKTMRKLPTGNFIAFPAEILRTGVNTIKRGFDELASDIPEIQRIGLRRLTGATTTFSLMPMALSEFSYMVSGVTEEMMDAYKRSLAPPWEKNARLLPTGKDKNGNITYINYSYSNPYDLLERIGGAAFNKYERAKQLGLPTSKAVSEAVNESLFELSRPFLDESILTAKVRDVLDPESEKPFGLGVIERGLASIAGTRGRGGVTSTGARVYNPEDTEGTKAAKSLTHILGGILPSVIPLEVSKGKIESSRFAQGFLNTLVKETPAKDRMGRERDLTNELIRAFTGVTENTVDVPLGLQYKGFEFMDANRNASGIFNSVARQKNVTVDQFVQAYKDANEARFRVHNEFRSTIDDMNSLGLNKNQIRRLFSKGKVYGVKDIVRGKFDPFDISDDIKDQMKINGTYDVYRRARREITKIGRQFKNRKFGEQLDQGNDQGIINKIMETIIPSAGAEEIQAPTAPPPPQQAPLNIQPPSASSSVGNINPLLVTNPVTRATFGSQ